VTPRRPCFARVRLAAIVMGLAFAAGPGAADQRSLVEVTASARYQSLRDGAMQFFRAIRQADKPTLVRLARAGARADVRKDLDNPTSALARILLTGSRAMRGRFMSVQVPRVLLFRLRESSGQDDIVLACFSDSRLEFTKPATDAELPPLDSNRAELCLPFVQDNRRWAVAYDLLPPG
jgi:hypothetical protein